MANKDNTQELLPPRIWAFLRGGSGAWHTMPMLPSDVEYVRADIARTPSTPAVDSQPTVESALAELKEWFPSLRAEIKQEHSEDYAAVYISLYRRNDPQAGLRVFDDFSDTSLAATMQRVRAYYDEGREADIDARRAALGD